MVKDKDRPSITFPATVNLSAMQEVANSLPAVLNELQVTDVPTFTLRTRQGRVRVAYNHPAVPILVRELYTVANKADQSTLLGEGKSVQEVLLDHVREDREHLEAIVSSGRNGRRSIFYRMKAGAL